MLAIQGAYSSPSLVFSRSQLCKELSVASCFFHFWSYGCIRHLDSSYSGYLLSTYRRTQQATIICTEPTVENPYAYICSGRNGTA